MTEREGIPQMPSPEEGEPPRSERDPRHPTATAPDSVEESVYEEAEYAGKDGPDAADPPTAASKAEDSLVETSTAPGEGFSLDPDADNVPDVDAGPEVGDGGVAVDPDAEPSADAEPGADLDPDESADLMETREEAHRIKQTRDDQQDEDLITLDPGD